MSYELPDEPFDGPDYNPDRDHSRLKSQISQIFHLMKDAQWRTLEEIAWSTGFPEGSISAQLRHLRKPRFGSHTVNREYVNNGLYAYQLIVNNEPR
jgi:hypothetical protein